MNNIPDWDQLLDNPNGANRPDQSVISARLAGEEVTPTRSIAPLMTQFGTTAAYTRELDAKAHEDVTMYVFKDKLRDAVEMYEMLDCSIENARGHFSRLGLMEFGEVIREEVEQGVRRFARRGSGDTEENITIHHTRQNGGYR